MFGAGKLAAGWLDAQEAMLSALRSRAGGRKGRAAHLETGEEGELAALFALRRRGYMIVARRWHTSRLRGDIDLIGWEGERLCFIEVKTRTARDMTPAESAVDEEKRTTLRRLAGAYPMTFPESERAGIAVRFDVVSVYMLGAVNEVEVFAGAFAME